MRPTRHFPSPGASWRGSVSSFLVLRCEFAGIDTSSEAGSSAMTNKAPVTLAAHRLAVGLLLIYDALFASHLKGAVSSRWVMLQPDSLECSSVKVWFQTWSDSTCVVSSTAPLGGAVTHPLKPIQPTFWWSKNGNKNRQCHFLSDSRPFVA